MSDTPETPETAADEAAGGEQGRLATTGAPAEVIRVTKGMFGVSGTPDTSGFGGLERTVLMPGAATPPYGGWFDEAADVLAEVLAEGEEGGWEAAVEKVVIENDELTLFIRREHLVRVARFLRDDPDLRFEMCMGVAGVHYPTEPGRELHAVYPFLSITHNRRLRLEVVCPDTDPHIPSIVPVYPSNDWHEREAWDFFGIVFDGHPALTRIQMPDDWPGHPQRKDYPLGGIPVEYKGATIPSPDTRRQYR
ncbi:MAG: NADH-quinone oxidoreductase subunit C [Actinomycetales bacterium]